MIFITIMHQFNVIFHVKRVCGMWLILVVMLTYSGKVWKGHTNVFEPVKGSL